MPPGDLFFVTSDVPGIREVRTDGTIVTPPWVGTDAAFSITNTADGTIYFTQLSSGSGPATETFNRVAPDGTVTSLFTTSCCYVGLASPVAGQLVSVNSSNHVVRINLSTDQIADTGMVTAYPAFASSPSGAVYVTTNTNILRLNADNTTTVIGGNGSVGSPTGLLTPGPATSSAFQPIALAYTPAGTLLFSAAHAVYRLLDPDHAG